jgi:hypothetical protein
MVGIMVGIMIPKSAMVLKVLDRLSLFKTGLLRRHMNAESQEVEPHDVNARRPPRGTADERDRRAL